MSGENQLKSAESFESENNVAVENDPVVQNVASNPGSASGDENKSFENGDPQTSALPSDAGDNPIESSVLQIDEIKKSGKQVRDRRLLEYRLKKKKKMLEKEIESYMEFEKLYAHGGEIKCSSINLTHGSVEENKLEISKIEKQIESIWLELTKKKRQKTESTTSSVDNIPSKDAELSTISNPESSADIPTKTAYLSSPSGTNRQQKAVTAKLDKTVVEVESLNLPRHDNSSKNSHCSKSSCVNKNSSQETPPAVESPTKVDDQNTSCVISKVSPPTKPIGERFSDVAASRPPKKKENNLRIIGQEVGALNFENEFTFYLRLALSVVLAVFVYTVNKVFRGFCTSDCNCNSDCNFDFGGFQQKVIECILNSNATNFLDDFS